MNFKLSRTALIATCVSVFSAGTATADASIAVYLECSSGTELRQGSGILVGPDGHVLTARHVAEDGFRCRGAIGNNTKPLHGLIVDAEDAFLPQQYDARLLRFVGNAGQTFDFAHFCPVTRSMQGARIQAFGWHPRKQGYPSQTSGVLSSHISNARGIVESDAMSSPGKSGGPVFLDGTRDIVGIIIGSEFDATPEGQTTTFDLRVVPGFREAITTMPVGAKWKLFLSPELAYGERRASADIAPNSTLIFELELVAIEDAPQRPQLPFQIPGQ